MTSKHHPDDATLMAYAAGSLDEAFAVVVSCHLETCPECRKAVRLAEAIGGNELENGSEKAEVSEGAFGRLLECIAVADRQDSPAAGKARPAPRKRTNGKNSIPVALQGYVGGSIDDVKWKRIGPGIWQMPIRLGEGAGASLRLLRISPGRKVPEHGHGGQEMTMILSGAYDDEIGHFAAGDVADLDPSVEHQPVASAGEDCICLAATEAPTRFKGVFSRLLQPIVGI